jgi:peptide/nickel transport system substrate-binding protein
VKRAALVACLLACGGATAALSRAPASAQTSTRQVTVPFSRDEGILTPYSFELGYPFVTLVYDTLLWRDRNGRPRPWLARSVKRMAGGRQLVVQLRKGVRWHDGRLLTAADVAFTFAYVKSRPHLRFTPQLRGILRVRAESASSVTIDLRHPAPGVLDQPLADLPILPRHLWAGLGQGEAIPPGMPIGSGPYRLASYVPGKGYRFEANRGYFLGRPRVARIEVDFMRGGQRSLDALARGDVDIVPTGLDEAGRAQFPSGGDIEVREGVNYTGVALSLNLRKAPFDRVGARRAVARALGVERIAGALGGVPPKKGFLHPDSPWAPDREPRLRDGSPGRQLGSSLVTVLAARDSPVRLEIGRQVVAAMRRAGARARLIRVSRRAFDRALGNDRSRPDFQAAVTAIPPLASHDPDYLRTVFGTGAPLNHTGYRSAAFERLSELVARTPDRRTRLRAVEAELGRLAVDVPAIPLAFSQGAFVLRPARYDGWVSVKGTGAFDKRSFLALDERERAAESTSADDSSDGFSLGAPGVASLALLAVAIAVAAAGLRRRRATGS